MRSVQSSGLRWLTHNIQAIHITPTQNTLFRIYSFIVILWSIIEIVSPIDIGHWQLALSPKVHICIYIC